jgi:hypothetical protein
MTAVVGFSLLRCLPSELNEMIEGMIAVEGRAGGWAICVGQGVASLSS